MSRRSETSARLGWGLTCALVLVACALALVGCGLMPGMAAASTLRYGISGTSTSQNWAGYAAHDTGVAFRKVSGTWRIPTGACTANEQGYSAFWVGLGGYSLNSDALEQIGTELDCRANGGEKLSAWYELVPAPSRTVRLKLNAGDLLSASVIVAGSQVTLKLNDRSSGRKFTKTITDHTVDATSAEWIAEAPSQCFNADRCLPLPLADFGSVKFSRSYAQTEAGKAGSITDSLWHTTKIVLNAGARPFVGYGGTNDNAGAVATPSALTSGGKTFSVKWTQGTAEAVPPGSQGGGGPPAFAGASVRRGERLVQDVRRGFSPPR
jgi:hypothetical protein